MRLILIFIVASILGYGVLQLNKLDPDNYVKMYLGNYVVELKVVQFVILLTLIVMALYFLLWLFHTLLGSPKFASRWWHRRNRNIAEQQFGAGYLSLIKGDWRRAENQLTKHCEHSHISFVNYLAAARAAAEQGKLTKRDDYLQSAYQAAPKERLAIGLTKAKLHEQAGQMEEARATLEDLRTSSGSNPQLTAMLLQVHERMQNWGEVEALLPAAKKQRALPKAMLSTLQDHVATGQLLVANDKAAAFNKLPRDQRKRADNIAIYANQLMQDGKHFDAEKILTAALKSDWSDALVELLGQLQSTKPVKLLRQLEGWLMARPENAHLNLAAGRQAKAANSLEAAKKYLQTAISQGKLPAAYVALGEVYEANAEHDKARQLYRVGMQSVSHAELTQPSALGKLV